VGFIKLVIINKVWFAVRRLLRNKFLFVC